MKYSLVLVSKFFIPLFLFQRANKQLSILLGYYIAIQALNYHHSYISKQLPPYSRRSQPAQHGADLWWSANLRAQRFRAPEGGYILSSLREERLGEKGGAFFNGKEGFCPL
jgi:hypothetical protein